MKLSHDDVAPLLAIFGAGALGVMLTAGTLVPRLVENSAPQEIRLVGAAPAVQVESVVAAIEELEALFEQQREVTRRVDGLPWVRPDKLDAEIAELREGKEMMMTSLEALERYLVRAMESRSAGDSQARTLEAYRIGDRLSDKVRYSRNTIEQWDPQSAMALEQDIEVDLRSMLTELLRLDIERAARQRGR